MRPTPRRLSNEGITTMTSEDPKIHSQDQQKKIDLDGTTIIGSMGPNVVVSSGNVTAINIAGGTLSGDVYQVVSETRSDDIVQIAQAIAEEPDLKDEGRDELRVAARQILDEAAKGEQANVDIIYVLLRAIGEQSPNVQRVLASQLTELPSVSAAVRKIARQALKNLRK
jgi:hypothetical protein